MRNSAASPARRLPRFRSSLFAALLLALLLPGWGGARAATPERGQADATHVPGERVSASRKAVVNFRELARREALGLVHRPPVRARLLPELFEEEEGEPGAAVTGAPAQAPLLPASPMAVQLASPAPSASFMGLDDIPMVDSSYIVIPPDVGGAVGQTKILEGLNNNYRALDKATGATLSTVGTATFWAATGAPLDALTDPRTVYDPYNDRWIAVMQTFESSASILVGVSQTSDPEGAWYLYRFDTGVSIDFPNLGFNKNWIVVSINRYSPGGTFQRGITLVVDYPQARAGTGVGTIFTQSANSHFCSSPCVTYSATADTEYVVTHLSSANATYVLDYITGTPSSPTYVSGTSALTRPGGGWVQPSGNLLPQSAPVAGSSACGATPCPIEVQDAQVRSAPAYRDGSIWYAQTIGLPSSGLTHTGVQWSRIRATDGAFLEGGRLEDPTATASNGGAWYAYPHLATNAAGDFVLGFSRFSSADHPSAGYAVHRASDGSGSLRDAYVFHAGEDYYHKTFTTAAGRNRWGDFSTAAVDPDDVGLWTVQEYAKARVGTDDGNGGANGSRWSTWWAGIDVTAPTPVVTLDPGPAAPEGDSGVTPFTFTVRLSAASALPVDVTFHTVDSTATVADGDYMTLDSTITIPAGQLTGSFGVRVLGDTLCEPDEVFGAVLASAHNAVVGTDFRADATILADDSKTIEATAGTGGNISPSGTVSVACFDSVQFQITPDSGFQIADVLVNGGSVGPVPAYTFTNVTTSGTIHATFSPVLYTLTLTSLGVGSLTKAPDQPDYASGSLVDVTATPGAGFAFVGWSGDTTGNDNPLTVLMNGNKNITGQFDDVAAPAVTVLSPNGGESFPVGSMQSLQWNALDNQVVARVTLALSRSGPGGPFDTLAADVPNTGQWDWTVTGSVTAQALLQVTARDSAGNAAADTSDSSFAISTVTAVDATPVTRIELSPVAPNPVVSSGAIAFALPFAMHIRLEVLDVQGRQVALLADGDQQAGRYRQIWRPERGRAGSGLYFVRLRAGGRTLVQRVALVR